MSDNNKESIPNSVANDTEPKLAARPLEIVKYKNSKVPLLLSLLALVSVGYLGFQAVYGPYGIKEQNSINHQLKLQVSQLTNDNQSLKTQVSQLVADQALIESTVRNINPSQTSILVYQLNAIITSANQSLNLYHDLPSTIKLLSYAKQILTANSDPIFMDLKINLTKDLDRIQAQNSYDNVMLASQIDNLYNETTHLRVVAPEVKPVAQSTNNSVWHKMLLNIKNSIFSLVKVEKTNQAVADLIVPENESVIRQHLQIDLLNARQALLTRNQGLWSNSLSDAENLVRHYFIADQLTLGQLQIINQLQNVSLSANQANLDLTMQSLIKLQELNVGK